MNNDNMRPRVSRLTLKLTDACNLGCTYCFARRGDVVGCSVSEEDFGYFLEFSMRSGMRGIRLTGGEPMLHPHIRRFVRLAVQAGLPVHIFSNLTIPGCIQGIEVPARAISFLANVNDRDTYEGSDWDALTENLKQASARHYQTVLAYTVHSVKFDLGHLKDLAVKYGIAKIRISPSMPMIGAGNLWLGPEDIPPFAESAYALHRELAALGKRLVLDCPIPLCHIPPKYLPFFLTDLKLIGHCCFGISVDVNLEVGHCYITNELLERRSLRSFADLSEMLDYMDGCVSKLDACCPPFPICADCDYGTQGICTAGCYGIRHYEAHRREGHHV
jgi:MoaA/NifB/PqqE/SkfB family radical SAM enzyme